MPLFKSKVERLKAKARRLYYQRAAIFDSMDCGHELAMFISSRYRSAHNELQLVMDQIRKLDPNCPAGEL